MDRNESYTAAQQRFPANRTDLIRKVESAYNHNYILTHHAVIDITGDLVAGILFDRMLYWFAPDQNGNSKLRVYKNGYYWLVKGRMDWQDEIRISPKQYDRASKILMDLNLIVVERWKFSGSPTLHIRINYDEYYKLLNQWKMDMLQKLIAEEKMLLEDQPPAVPMESNPMLFAQGMGFKDNAPDYTPNDSDVTFPESVFTQRGKTEYPDGKQSSDPKVNNEHSETGRTLTKNTTKTTSEITENNKCAANAARESSEPSGDIKTAKKRSIPKTEIDKEFNILWELYPTGRKQGKVKAKESFAKARNEGVSFDTIKDGLEAYNRYIDQNRVARKFVKMAQTWFNNRSWEDEYEDNGGGRNGSDGINHATHSSKGTVYGNFIG